MKAIEERSGVTSEQFHNEIRPRALPIVLRGLVKDWPAVKAALQGPHECADYIADFATDKPQKIGVGAPEINGLFHYDDELRGLNFGWGAESVTNYFDRLIDEFDKVAPSSMAMQALPVHEELIGFEEQNPRPFAPSYATPYMWIGNALKVATHSDAYENIACVISGCRRFTIFPPEQIGNLYMGPLHFTPAGTPISMVHLTNPDYEKFPKFAAAMESAQFVDLLPGDALYLPYQWYHHVESKTKFNILLNYWWSDARKDIGSPWNALMQNMLSISHMPPEQRIIWRTIFDHFVFHLNGDPWAHIPPHARGPLAHVSPDDVAKVQQYIISQLQNRPNK